MMNCQSCHGMCPVHKAAFVLLVVGGLNWGLVGLAQYDLVMSLLGAWPMLVRAVYVLVGLSALMMLMKGKCKMCTMAGEGSGKK